MLRKEPVSATNKRDHLSLIDKKFLRYAIVAVVSLAIGCHFALSHSSAAGSRWTALAERK
jgi:hypothetical protein